MKWNGMGQWSKGRAFKTLGVSLAVGLGMTACSRDYTVAYLYVTSATKGTAGVVNEFAVDFQTGALTPLAESSVPTGVNPVGLVASPDQKTVYVINNASPTSTVIEYSIGTDGKLYPENTYDVVQNTAGTIVGTNATAISIDPAGNFLYITVQYQAGFSTASPGPGAVAVYPITHSTDLTQNGKLGSPVMNGTLPYFPVGDNPSGIVVSPKGGYVYVIDQEKPSGGAAFGVLLAFTQSSTGSLTAIPGPVSGGFAAGTTPAGIAEDPGGHFIYVTDETTNQLYGYLATAGANASPLAMNSSPYNTGSFPLGVTVDPRGLYVYVANFTSSTVSAYAINSATGALSGVSGASGNAVATGPTCVAIEPALGIYLYTSNYTDGSVSGEQLNPNTGALTQVPESQFPTAALPTCAVAVANGAHATQLID
jgi:6-phosphogluconolactonase